MEPNIRNHRSGNLAEGAGRLVALDDNPITCTLSYSRIEPGKTSSHHIHPWEHEIYIIKGSGTLICDGKEYPVKEGDAMFIPGNVDHYTLNNGRWRHSWRSQPARRHREGERARRWHGGGVYLR